MNELSLPRRMWTLFEPIHVATYFAPQARAAFEAAGLRGFWRGYFAGRAAPLGPIGPGPVVASFFSFAPSMVRRALPDVWTRATPQATLDARAAGAVEALRAVLSDVDTQTISDAAELLRVAASTVEVQGRVLGAANADLPWPAGDPLEVLWHAATILREHRGDGHIAALVTAGLDGCECLVWRAALTGNGLTGNGLTGNGREGNGRESNSREGNGREGVGREGVGRSGYSREVLQPARGWTDEEWDAAAQRLVSRGWLTGDGEATATAHSAYEQAEAITDRLASGPWDRLGAEATERCERLLAPLAARVSTYLPHPNPIGLPPR